MKKMMSALLYLVEKKKQVLPNVGKINRSRVVKSFRKSKSDHLDKQ